MTHGRRIGILGGTFDPIHHGHLIMAENAAEDLGLSSVLFAPAGTPPHKQHDAVTPATDRVAMVDLAIADRPGFDLSRIDMDGVAVSYTWMLLERLRDALPNDELWFILGGDSLHDFPRWENPDRILNVSRLAVIDRPGYVLADESSLPDFVARRVDRVEAPLCDVSSTDIRERVQEGRSIRYLVPEPVRSYILQRDLYRDVPVTAATNFAE